jgi:ribosomal protein S18 acetylase RimI-like enzyme
VTRRDLGDGFELDDDKARVDLREVHRYLCDESYWAASRPFEVQERLVREASRVVGLYVNDRQIGFCRATSDDVSLAYLADVYVLTEFRGRGLGEELVREMIENGPYAETRWILHTTSMHRLYRKFGFGEPDYKLMERPRKSQASDSG